MNPGHIMLISDVPSKTNSIGSIGSVWIPQITKDQAEIGLLVWICVYVFTCVFVSSEVWQLPYSLLLMIFFIVLTALTVCYYFDHKKLLFDAVIVMMCCSEMKCSLIAFKLFVCIKVRTFEILCVTYWICYNISLCRMSV